MIVPLANEYQVQTVLDEADILLTDVFVEKGCKNVYSDEIVKELLFADFYGLKEFKSTLIQMGARNRWQ